MKNVICNAIALEEAEDINSPKIRTGEERKQTNHNFDIWHFKTFYNSFIFFL